MDCPSPTLHRTALAPEIRFILEALAVEPGVPLRPPSAMDWPRFLACVRHHRVALSLGGALDAVEGVPDAVCAEVARMRRAATLKTMDYGRELVRITEAFAAAGIEALALKGPAFAALVYGDAIQRPVRDLDFLVRPEAEVAALAVLRRFGYGEGPGTVLHELNAVELHHRDGASIVELHVRLADADALFPTGVLDPFRDKTSVRVAGTAVDTPALEPAIVYAAYHGARHLWTRLFWLVDLARAARDERVDWERAVAIARRTGAERHLALGHMLARDLLGAPLPAAVVRDARTVVAARRAAMVMPQVLDPPPVALHAATKRIGRLRTLGWELGLYRRPAARLACLRVRAQPSATDHGVVRLRRGLGFLYYAVRIVRVLRTVLSKAR